LLSARKNMDVVDAYTRLGSYRAAGEVCGVDPKTVKRKVLAHEAGVLDAERAERGDCQIVGVTDLAHGCCWGS
jgi:hypothetical protein